MDMAKILKMVKSRLKQYSIAISTILMLLTLEWRLLPFILMGLVIIAFRYFDHVEKMHHMNLEHNMEKYRIDNGLKLESRQYREYR